MIPVNSTSGFDSRSHFIKQIKRLKKYERLGRKIIIFYLGDYDPSGLSIQQSLEDMLAEEGLTNFEFKRIGVTLDQIKRLHLYEVVDPAKLRALQNDSRGPKFEWEHGRRFAVEVDTMSSGKGLKELKRLIRKIFRDYWDEETWQKYAPIFNKDKVKLRLAAMFVKYAQDIKDAVAPGADSLEDFVNNIKSEEDELREIEGDGYREPIDEEEEEEEQEEDDAHAFLRNQVEEEGNDE